MKTRIPSFHLFFDRDFIVTVPMNSPQMMVGRRTGCHLRINHSSISREHCEIVLTEDGQVILKDLRSTNMTRVNGQVVTNQPLTPGDVIDLGRCSLIFQEVVPSLFHAYGANIWKYLKKPSSKAQLSSPRGKYQFVQNDLVTEFNVESYHNRYTPERTEYIRKIPRLKLIAVEEDNEVTQLSSISQDWVSPSKKSRLFRKSVWFQSAVILLFLIVVILILFFSTLIQTG